MKPQFKQSILAAALAAGILTLGGCSNPTESESNSSQTSPESSSQTSPESSLTSTESSSAPAESVHDPETQAIIDEFPYDTLTGFDGKDVSKNDAVGAIKSDSSGTVFLTYDFAYLRYAKPIFKTTLDDPDVYNPETGEFDGVDSSRLVSDPDYFKVKAGDVLENGLTVKDAETIIFPLPVTDENGNSKVTIYQNRSTVNFEGQLTLSGILNCQNGDDYMVMDGDLKFFPDPSDVKIIVPSKEVVDYAWLFWSVDAENDFAICMDGHRFMLGNINAEDAPDVSGIINKGEYKKVTVTLENIRTVSSDSTGISIYGKPVSIEVNS